MDWLPKVSFWRGCRGTPGDRIGIRRRPRRRRRRGRRRPPGGHRGLCSGSASSRARSAATWPEARGSRGSEEGRGGGSFDEGRRRFSSARPRCWPRFGDRTCAALAERILPHFLDKPPTRALSRGSLASAAWSIARVRRASPRSCRGATWPYTILVVYRSGVIWVSLRSTQITPLLNSLFSMHL